MIWHTFFNLLLTWLALCAGRWWCFALSLSTTMLGVLLLLRRMSLMGDALSIILPGVAAGYLLNGMSLLAMASLLAMSVGGFIAGIAVALVAGWVSRRTPPKMRTPVLPGLHLGLAGPSGVTLVSLRGPQRRSAAHLLFGSILADAVDSDAAFFVTGVKARDAAVHCAVCAVLSRAGQRGVR